MKKLTILLLLLSAAIAPLRGWAAPAAAKIAVVDLDRVMRYYYKSRIAADSLRSQSDIFQAYLNKQTEDLAALDRAYRIAAANAGNIALAAVQRKKYEEEAAAQAQKIKIRRAEIEAYTVERKQQLLTIEERKRAEILADISAEIKRRAAVEGWTLVLDRSAVGNAGLPLVVWSAPGGDLTESVIEELNRGSRPTPEKETKTVKDIR